MNTLFFKKVWALLSEKHNKQLYLLIMMIVIGMLFESLGLGIIFPVLSIVTNQNYLNEHSNISHYLNSLFEIKDHANLVIFILVLLIAIYTAKSIYLGVLSYYQSRFCYLAQMNLSNRLFNNYLRQSMSFHSQTNSSDLVTNLMNETLLFRDTVLLLVMVVAESSVVLCAFGVALIFEPLATIAVFGFFAAVGWAFRFYSKDFVSKAAERRQYYDKQKNSVMQQGLSCIKEIKVLGCEEYFMRKFERPNKEYIRSGIHYATISQMPRLWVETVSVIVFALLLMVMTVKDVTFISVVPSLGLFIAIFLRLLPSVNRILGALQGVSYGVPAINTLFSEFAHQTFNDRVIDAKCEKKSFSNSVKLVNLFYTPPGKEKPVISNLNFEITQGEIIGIFGPSGSGKSTILDILAGLINPDSGEIYVDGVVSKLCDRSWQDQIGYVGQSTYLIGDTIRRNIAFGVDDSLIDESGIADAINKAHLEEWVLGLPEGLDTVIGEGGALLSGGQRQRVSIARALYSDRSIMLLDEITSALDSMSEGIVMQAMEELKGGKTVIIVAHRMSTLSICNRIFKFEKGGLSEVDRLEHSY